MENLFNLDVIFGVSFVLLGIAMLCISLKKRDYEKWELFFATGILLQGIYILTNIEILKYFAVIFFVMTIWLSVMKLEIHYFNLSVKKQKENQRNEGEV